MFRKRFFRGLLGLALGCLLIAGQSLAMTPSAPKKINYARALTSGNNAQKKNSLGSQIGSRPHTQLVSASVETVTLYHATNRSSADHIVQSGVRVDAGGERKDFGQGFYTTTNREQARDWANRRGTPQNPGAVISFVVEKPRLDGLRQLHMNQVSPVIAERIVEKNRIIGTSAASVVFDTVEGSMLMNVQAIMADTRYGFTAGVQSVWSGHQLSFHTREGAAVLDGSQRSILPP